ncbi:MAG TPA: trypsin-like serine protease [Clostridiales bacterium]|nr:trypsin-like serine protease [Clostridiales bacterium]
MDKESKPNFIIIDSPEETVKDENSDFFDSRFVEKEKPNLASKPKGKGWGKKLLAGLLVVLLAFGAGYGGGLAAARQGGEDRSAGGTGAIQAIQIKPNDDLNTAEAIAAKVIPSVVGISTITKVVSQDFWGMLQENKRDGIGTGMIVDASGYILTNSHVISDGKADNITVQLFGNKEYKAKFLWADPTIDLAIIKIEASGLQAVELGDSDTVQIGSYAVAIGNPLGLEFDRSVTQGVISGLDRTITVAGQGGQFGGGQNAIRMEGLMQTDASINNGNSGGPLLNSRGEVIGINSAKAASAEGLGFAIPINIAKPIIEEIKQTGQFNKAYIGISGVNVADYQRYYPNDKLGTDTGVFVGEVIAASPADLGGLKVGDVIVAVNDKTIETMNQLTRSLFAFSPGETVTLKIFRDQRSMEVEVRLGTAPVQS